MYHSITFGNKNTWDDWHLIPEERPLFLPPDTKTKYVDIPGANGHKDISEALTGEPLYENRTGDITFYVMNGYQDWTILYSEIMNYLHGQQMNAFLEDDPYFYYEGRFFVNEWASEKDYSKIVISYNVAPYKIDMLSSKDAWLWDPFNFEVGVIREYNNVRVDDILIVNFIGSRRTYIPTFEVILDNPNNPITLTWSELPNNSFGLVNGKNKIPDIRIKNTDSVFTFTGKGVVSIDYRGGSL
jgi:hypothetical protein